jgi:hypothetical protein
MSRYVQLLTAATATSSAPSAATAGVEIGSGGPAVGSGIGKINTAVILVKSTAGSGDMDVTLRLWCYSPVSATWHVLGTSSTITDRGLLNEGEAIAEDGTDLLHHAELVYGLLPFTRAYLQVIAINGTATAVSAWLVPGE